MTTETGAPSGIDYPEPPQAGERMHDDSIEQMLTDEVIGGAST